VFKLRIFFSSKFGKSREVPIDQNNPNVMPISIKINRMNQLQSWYSETLVQLSKQLMKEFINED